MPKVKSLHKLVHEARDLIKKAEKIELKAEADPRLFGFASIHRSIARDNLTDASIILEETKGKSARILMREAVNQATKALEDYRKHQGHYATNEEVRKLEAELREEGLL